MKPLGHWSRRILFGVAIAVPASLASGCFRQPAPTPTIVTVPDAPTVVDPVAFGAVGDGATDDTQAWRAAIKAVSPFGVIDGRGRSYHVEELRIESAATIRNAHFVRDSTGDLLHVVADGVTVSECTITGGGHGGAGRSTGLVARDVDGFELRNTVVSALDYQGIQMNGVSNFTIENCSVHHIAYAGIMILSCARGVVRANVVHTITQPEGFINSYGITVSRVWARPLREAPHSEHIEVAGNHVRGVRQWKGLDTHGGRHISFTGNRVTDCLVGIAAVPSKGLDGENEHAPLDCTITDNLVDAVVTTGTRSSGIAITGATKESGRIAEFATGAIQGNVVQRHGTEGSPNSAGILLTCTSEVEVTGNTLQECSPSGVTLLRDNVKALVEANEIVDVWSGGSTMPAAVTVIETNTDCLITRNRLVRGTTTAQRVNRVGLLIGPGNPGIRHRANEFETAARAVFLRGG